MRYAGLSTILEAEAAGVAGVVVWGLHRDTLATAREIWQKEHEQAVKIRAGETLRVQTAFDDYLARRAEDAAYTFRRHLRAIGGAIEE